MSPADMGWVRRGLVWHHPTMRARSLLLTMPCEKRIQGPINRPRRPKKKRPNSSLVKPMLFAGRAVCAIDGCLLARPDEDCPSCLVAALSTRSEAAA